MESMARISRNPKEVSPSELPFKPLEAANDDEPLDAEEEEGRPSAEIISFAEKKLELQGVRERLGLEKSVASEPVAEAPAYEAAAPTEISETFGKKEKKEKREKKEKKEEQEEASEEEPAAPEETPAEPSAEEKEPELKGGGGGGGNSGSTLSSTPGAPKKKGSIWLKPFKWAWYGIKYGVLAFAGITALALKGLISASEKTLEKASGKSSGKPAAKAPSSGHGGGH